MSLIFGVFLGSVLENSTTSTFIFEGRFLRSMRAGLESQNRPFDMEVQVERFLRTDPMCYANFMCEAKAYIEKENGLELFMEDVVSITPEGTSLLLKDILGNSKTIEAQIKQIGLLDHKIILQAGTTHQE